MARGPVKRRLRRNPDGRVVARAVVLFADVMNASTISEILDLVKYDRFLTEFQMTAKKTIDATIRDHYKDIQDVDACMDCSIRGDEACLMLYTDDPELDIRAALVAATRLKAAFLSSKHNLKRLASERSFFDLGIGIHAGQVTLGIRDTGVNGHRIKPEGYTINLAKRVESFSREGMFSHIMVSGDARMLAEEAGLQIAFQVTDKVVHKGLLNPTAVHEMKSPVHLKERWPARIIQGEHERKAFEKALRIDRESLWLRMALAHYHFDQEDYELAARDYDLALRTEPKYAVPRMYLGRALYRMANLASGGQERETLLRRAIEELEHAAQATEVRSVTVHDFLAVAYRRLGEYEKAIQRHQEACRISPKSRWARNAYAYTLAEMGLTGSGRDGDLETATRIARDLRRDHALMSDYDYLVYHTSGLIRMVIALRSKRPHMDPAIKDFENALEGCAKIASPKKKAEKRAEILFHIGMAYHKQAGGTSHSSSRTNARKAREAFRVALKEVQGLANWEPYWLPDARQRMGDIDFRLGGETVTRPRGAPAHPRAHGGSRK